MIHDIRKVAEFHLVGGHPIRNSDSPALISVERAASRANWMQEEIDEFKEAISKGDLPGAFDALGDLLYFAFGTAVEMGGQEVLSEVFARIHRANMSKFDKTVVDAELTVQAYAEKNIQVHCRQVEANGMMYYPVYFSDGEKKGKIGKSHKWQEPDFTDLFPAKG